MIIVISDIHLNDGTVCKATDAYAAEMFFQDLEEQIISAGNRADGSYVPIEEVTIIMLGDIFDFIRTERWLRNKDGTPHSIRPWSSVDQYAPIVEGICDDIIENNQGFLDHFKNAAKNGIALTTNDGKTSKCKVNIFYMVGNHDWFPYVKDERLDGMRQKLRDAFGLRQFHFPWKIEEWTLDAAKIHDICMEHRLYVQHGDQYDEFNYHAKLGRGESSIGDAIVVELITKFPIEVVRRIKETYPEDELRQDFLDALKELDNVRPSHNTVIYLRNLIDKLTRKKHRDIVREVFYDCTRSVEKSEIFRRARRVDKKAALKLQILNVTSKFAPTAMVRWVIKLLGLAGSSYQSAAENEPYVKDGRCDFVTYGHTHELEVKGIGMRVDGFSQTPKVYINSASWRPVNNEIITEHRMAGFPYFSEKNMVWVAYYKDGERRGRPYEVWSGELSQG